MIVTLIQHPHQIAVLSALDDGPLRFAALKAATGLESSQLNRCLKAMTKAMLVIPHTIPTEGVRIFVEYRLGKRGAAALRQLEAVHGLVHGDHSPIGRSSDRELEALLGST